MVATNSSENSNTTRHGATEFNLPDFHAEQSQSIETALLHKLIDAFRSASQHNITDHEMSMLISQAAYQTGFNLMYLPVDESDLNGETVNSCLQNLVDGIDRFTNS